MKKIIAVFLFTSFFLGCKDQPKPVLPDVKEELKTVSETIKDSTRLQGVTIYNVPTLKMADSLANSDPMVIAGRLIIEIHPWWAAKGFQLR